MIVEAIEVKAHNDEEAGTREQNGVIEGKAVVQVQQTLRVLADILNPAATSPVAKARSAVLRDQLYRAVAARPYDRERRQRYVNLLEELFDKGPSILSGMIFKVRVDASAPAPISPSEPRFVKGPAGDRIGVVELVERGASSRTAPPRPPVDEAPRRASDPAVNKSEAAAGERLRVYIGDSPSGAQIFWDPHDSAQPLNNFGLHITGDSGSGKTQTIKAIISGVCAHGLPVCIFEFKPDYSLKDFSEPLGLRVYDVAREALPFNPLHLVPDGRGEIYPIVHVHEVAGILRRVFQLGDQQEARLKEALKGAYTSRGFSLDRQIPKGRRESPTFDDVKTALEAGGKNEPLLNRLSPLFDLHLFPSDKRAATTFEQMCRVALST